MHRRARPEPEPEVIALQQRIEQLEAQLSEAEDCIGDLLHRLFEARARDRAPRTMRVWRQSTAGGRRDATAGVPQSR